MDTIGHLHTLVHVHPGGVACTGCTLPMRYATRDESVAFKANPYSVPGAVRFRNNTIVVPA